MMVLPVEPIILERKDSREALSLHLTRNGATVEGPLAEGGVVDERPGITGVRNAVAVELKDRATGYQCVGDRCESAPRNALLVGAEVT